LSTSPLLRGHRCDRAGHAGTACRRSHHGQRQQGGKQSPESVMSRCSSECHVERW
jgi:hypothetical protein